MFRVFFVVIPVLLLAGCSGTVPKNEAKTYSAGEKAQVGPLIYNVVDTQFLPVLGDDPASQRTPTNRFATVEVSVTNTGNTDANIPAMTLVDDSGQTYPELGDGTNVSRWLGVVRKVGPVQTESGQVVFDAPAKHYRLRLTDETEEDIRIDLPLTFIHEEMNDLRTSGDAVPAIINVPPAKK